MQNVIIETMGDNLYHLYDEAGSIVEPDFNTYDEAWSWAINNKCNVVESFNI
jgi:hypothetical protein